MPRKARLDAPGVLHHVMIRGIERRNIFRSDRDREDFLERLEGLLVMTQTCCYAWVFIPNHAHFLFRTGTAGLATLMRRLLTGYAVSFNLRYRRSGQLFQNRYKSIICQEDLYFRELVRYIHLNPIRARIVPDLSSLDGYAYSGHSAIMGKVKRGWQDCEYVLRHFNARSLNEAREVYRAYVESGVGQGRRNDLVGGGLIRSIGGWKEAKKLGGRAANRIKGDERILGGGEFVERLLSDTREKYERRYELKRLGFDLKKVAERVGELLGIEPIDVLSKGGVRHRVKARSLLCFWAVSELGISGAELSRRFEMRPSSISYAIQRGEKIASENGYKLIDEIFDRTSG